MIWSCYKAEAFETFVRFPFVFLRLKTFCGCVCWFHFQPFSFLLLNIFIRNFAKNCIHLSNYSNNNNGFRKKKSGLKFYKLSESDFFSSMKTVFIHDLYSAVNETAIFVCNVTSTLHANSGKIDVHAIIYIYIQN